ncbi:MAG TPA: hypothetical protein VG458_08405 [Solirubrobacterales bacterium]|nr:hypothetical protein [Solirubrobacterales bacterium]
MGRPGAGETELRRRNMPFKLLRHYRTNLSSRQRVVPPPTRHRRRRSLVGP